jgi:hypothetical protein
LRREWRIPEKRGLPDLERRVFGRKAVSSLFALPPQSIEDALSPLSLPKSKPRDLAFRGMIVAADANS